ncbi:hypothetical protein BJ508DRAFT_308117 [Ascobolus immersus RN42]|uniref:Uncharacterized protein n=1 Tax=Ascobolus immersus RN42 TaxID=1160509 RepID=A0A3N4I0J8_ASCIM|nr:hypothetical protein BJ508DRAFT_308117 [Ascobolus immersus RN42]
MPASTYKVKNRWRPDPVYDLMCSIGDIIDAIFTHLVGLTNERLQLNYEPEQLMRALSCEAVSIWVGPRVKAHRMRAYCEYSDAEIATFRSRRDTTEVTNALLDILAEEFPGFRFAWLGSLRELQGVCRPSRAYDPYGIGEDPPPFVEWGGICQELGRLRSDLASDLGELRQIIEVLGPESQLESLTGWDYMDEEDTSISINESHE